MSRIRRISSLDELEELASNWDELLNMRNQEQGIFQSYDWCRNAWDCILEDLKDELYVLVWRQEKADDMVIFPFCLDRNGVLRFIMDEHSDYCDCVYVLGHNHHLAYKEALEFIRADNRVKQICLHKMDGNSEALNYFAALAPQSVISKENTYSWIDVTPTDDFAASQPQLRSKDKANVRAIRRKAEKYELVVQKGGDSNYPAEDIDTLIDSMRRSGRRQESFMSDGLKRFCRRLFESGRADIVKLVDSAGAVAAINFILRMRSRRLSWIFLYADPHASTELYVKYFYSEAANEPFVFDFGTGGYEYKLGTFRPCTRALFGLNISLDKKLTIRLDFYRLICSAKRFVKSLLQCVK